VSNNGKLSICNSHPARWRRGTIRKTTVKAAARLKESHRDFGAPPPSRSANPGTLDCADEDPFAAELSLAQARRDGLLSLVQLYKALGGGWQ
jgi:hypothetical protein